MKRYFASLDMLLEGLVTDKPVPKEFRFSGLSVDSREIGSGDAFVALKGARFDARQAISTAFEAGAVATLLDADQQEGVDADVLARPDVFLVENLSANLSLIAGRFYQHPSHQMTLIGITGTNGKTTISYFLAQMLEKLGHTPTLLGTLGVGSPDSVTYTGMTTPDAVNLQKYLAEMRDNGVSMVCLEVSSHALALGRVAALRFEFLVFSNISQDHLDFHASMQVYQQAKLSLFSDFEFRCAVVNGDDALGREIALMHPQRTLSYGIENGDLRAVAPETADFGLHFNLSFKDATLAFESDLIGEFNVYNLLAVAGVGLAMGCSLTDVEAALKNCQPAPGRMQRVEHAKTQPVVVVDFAHTPDALDKALQACQSHCAGALSVVFGCGGDRDREKRPKMGGIAQRRAQRVYITDDNPRKESPAAIVRDIVSGMTQPAWVLHDRRKAIHAAITTAQAGDWVLIAGKGHETQQIYADRVLQLNDYELAKATLEALAA